MTGCESHLGYRILEKERIRLTVCRTSGTVITVVPNIGTDSGVDPDKLKVSPDTRAGRTSKDFIREVKVLSVSCCHPELVKIRYGKLPFHK